MVDVAQLVRVPDCDSGCCRFESGHPPENSRDYSRDFFSQVFREIPSIFFREDFFALIFTRGDASPSAALRCRLPPLRALAAPQRPG